MGIQIVGTGSYLPDNIVTNEDLATLGYDADWIQQRSGIRERRHAPKDISTSDMAVAAAEKAIDAAGIDRNEIDLLMLGTMSPDHLLPATATTVQDRLRINSPAVDLSAACAGFMYAFVAATQFVGTGCSRYALVIGSDTNSRVTDPNDRKTYPLFGDGAGAVVLARGSEEQGLLAYTLGSDGAGADLLIRPVGGARTPFNPLRNEDGTWFMSMDGRPVFKWAVRFVEDSSGQILSAAECRPEDVSRWIFHQANERILDAAIDSMEIDRDKVVKHLDRYGNTSTASIPIALDESVRGGEIERGDRLLLCGFGGGLSWGTVLLRW